MRIQRSTPAQQESPKTKDGAAHEPSGSRSMLRQLGTFEAQSAALAPSGGSGNMPKDVQAKMEGAFGADFSSVRVHEDASSEGLGARAYTQGSDIHFAAGQYQPGSSEGQALLGHELAHVVQQSRGRVTTTGQVQGVALNDDPSLEREADVMGAKAARGEATGTGGGAPVQAKEGPVQRKDEFYPSADREPHIHVHGGGITFTAVGHSHKSLVAGDVIRQAAVNEVIQELEAAGDERSLSIVEWIRENVADTDEDAAPRASELRAMLIEMGALTEPDEEGGQVTISLYDADGEREDHQSYEAVDDAITGLEAEIEASYAHWQKFQADEGQVLVGGRKALEDEDLEDKNVDQYGAGGR